MYFKGGSISANSSSQKARFIVFGGGQTVGHLFLLHCGWIDRWTARYIYLISCRSLPISIIPTQRISFATINSNINYLLAINNPHPHTHPDQVGTDHVSTGQEISARNILSTGITNRIIQRSMSSKDNQFSLFVLTLYTWSIIQNWWESFHIWSRY